MKRFQNIAGSVIVITAIFSLLCSIILLLLQCGRKHAYNFSRLIMTIAIFQIICDLGYFFHVAGFAFKPCETIANILFGLSFTPITIWMNLMSIFTLSLLYRRQAVDVNRYYPHCLGIAILPSFVWIVYELAFCYPKWDYVSYSYWRIALISMNALTCLLSSQRISKAIMRVFFKSVEESRELNHVIATKVNFCHVLASRLKFYPLCQLITRLPMFYFHIQYSSEELADPAFLSEQFHLLYELTYAMAASSGIFCFVVYLYIQPKAYTELKRMISEYFAFPCALFCMDPQLLYLCCCCCCSTLLYSVMVEDSEEPVSEARSVKRKPHPALPLSKSSSCPLACQCCSGWLLGCACDCCGPLESSEVVVPLPEEVAAPHAVMAPPIHSESNNSVAPRRQHMSARWALFSRYDGSVNENVIGGDGRVEPFSVDEEAKQPSHCLTINEIEMLDEEKLMYVILTGRSFDMMDRLGEPAITLSSDGGK